ncbi:hypothetical protein LTR36_008490 [Oleoguttula mirabilis]|uniref:Potassium transporter n=1 Tax=Oleoguttula mirabilis TaxID=1507867 RepID=A0AAV9JUD7_9PEZI|nr:hypothetical protein LTR36_008490 [Oleoguttula mirabilis]
MSRRSSRPRLSLEGRTLSTGLGEDDEEAGYRRPGDVKKKQTFKGLQLLSLAYQSIGVIYGDIGTSPLYVFSGVFTSEPERRDVIGVLSLIYWSLIIMVTLKYVIIILRADNEGEGGTFSTYSLLSRYANISNRDPREDQLVDFQRWNTGDMHPENAHLRKSLEKSRFFKAFLKFIGVLAVSMVLSDGVLTPAQSVLGAVQGIEVIHPSISHGTVLGAACGILVLLFVIQPFGTTKIGVAFAPIILFWLGLLAGFGVYNLVVYDASVLKAFNPGFAFEYLIRHGDSGWRSLGGVLLAFTGVEALFADLGAFGIRAIQISWLCWCLPCLLLGYSGQAAYLAVKPSAYKYPVFNTAPPGTLILSLVVAILAAIVASQAIITASFQLISQIVKLSYFPQIQVVHTSKVHHNHLYVPLVNYLLCIGTVAVTAAFKNTTTLGNAYGVCVMFVTFFDTTMTGLVALIVWRIRPYYIILPWLAIACMDGAFLSSALTKVPYGAWFTLSLALILACVFILWRYGKEQQWSAEAKDRVDVSHFVEEAAEGSYRLKTTNEHEVLSISKGFGIFFDKLGAKTPIVFSEFISKLVSMPEIVVFFHMRPLEKPTVPADERFTVMKTDLPNCYRVIVRHGYMDEVITSDLASIIYDKVRTYMIWQNARRATRQLISTPTPAAQSQSFTEKDTVQDSEKTSTTSGPELVAANLVQLQRAYEHRVLYVVGKEEMAIASGTRIWRAVLLRMFLFARENSRTKISNLNLPTDRKVEIGFVKEV